MRPVIVDDKIDFIRIPELAVSPQKKITKFDIAIAFVTSSNDIACGYFKSSNQIQHAMLFVVVCPFSYVSES